jgi:polar amino acid transport system substrate-binding protein
MALVDKIFYIACLFFATPLLADKSSKNASEVILASDNIPPYVYVNANQEVVGTLVTSLRKIFIQADVGHDFKYMPWNRAMSETLNKPNVLMYPVTRTIDREDKFEWIIPLISTNYRLFGIKGKYDPDKVNVTTGDYTFVCQETTVLCEILSSFGIPESSIVKRSSIEISQIANMLLRGRIDFLIASESALEPYVELMGMEASDMVPLTHYNYPVKEYLVGNKNMDVELVKKLRQAAALIEAKKSQ